MTELLENLEDENNYDELIVSIEANYQNLNILIAVCDDSQYREQIIQKYETELSPNIPCYRVELAKGEPSLRAAIASEVKTNKYLQAGKEAVITVTGVNGLLFLTFDGDGEKSEQEKFFGYLQWTREALREFPFSIVLWMTFQMERSLSKKAPDFWAWRKGVFRFISFQKKALTKQDVDFLRPVLGTRWDEVDDDEPNFLPVADLQELISDIEKEKGEKDSSLVTLYGSLGNIFYRRVKRGEYQEYQEQVQKAIAYFQKAIALQQELGLGETLASNLNNLAELFDYQGKYEAAEPLYKQAINHPSLATNLSNLANLYRYQGKYKAAETLCKQAIEIDKIPLPKNDSSLATHLNNLESLYESERRWDEVDENDPNFLLVVGLQKLIADIEREKGEKDASLVNLYESLGNIFYQRVKRGEYEDYQEQVEKAIEYFQKAIALQQEFELKEEGLATNLNNLALLYESQGKYEAAELLYEQAIEIDKIALPENHPSLATHLNNLALLYESQGKYEAAELLYKQAIKIDKIALSENHPSLATHLNNLAGLYKSQGKYEAAKPLYEQAIEIDEIALPENHPSLARDFNNLANLYRSQGKYEAYEAAESLYLQAIKILKAALPPHYPSLASKLNNLALLYESQGKYEAAEPLYLQAIKILKVVLPPNHPSLATHLNNLANLYRSQEKYKAAEPLYLQAIEIVKVALPPNHLSLAIYLNNLANLYSSQEKYEVAEPLYLQVLDIFEQILGQENPDTKTVLKNLERCRQQKQRQTGILSGIYKGIAWCLAWGDKKQPQFHISILEKMYKAPEENQIPLELQWIIDKVQKLQGIDKYFPEKITDLRDGKYRELWEEKTSIGLVYGGATKIKQYVFEVAKLTDIRGASAILDKINLVDLPGFFQPDTKSRKWLDEERNFPGLSQALISELLVYSIGGNILAFCPAAFVDDLANAIEKRYTEETLTANSCAVGSAFRLLEIRFGLLRENIEDTPWLDWYLQNFQDKLVESYYGLSEGKTEKELRENFQSRKNFHELTTKLATLFNQRRNGNDFNNNRPSRRYPPMFETHPYLRRDENDRRTAVIQADLPNNPYYSEVLARKHLVGQITKRDSRQNWYKKAGFDWQLDRENIKGWETKFEEFLTEITNQELAKKYNPESRRLEVARSLKELGNVYNGFIAYIYADGNNIAEYIQKFKTPEEYQKFSEDIFEATERSVYFALAEHLHPHKLKNLTDPDNENRNGHWIHPFEILAILGDNVMLIVPANKALEIAKTFGERFEEILAEKKGYEPKKSTYKPVAVHRYLKQPPNQNKSSLSMSIGVLITVEDALVYNALNLKEQLLKSAKKQAKKLKEKGYIGGTIDFLSFKSVTMISSDTEAFRQEALIKERGARLKLYAAPYTLHEIGGLIELVKALKKSKFPKSQIYQIRSLLEKGKNTGILNYRYFRARFQSKDDQKILENEFENPWCSAKKNDGNLAPWMYDEEKMLYETIWQEIVDIYDFIEI